MSKTYFQDRSQGVGAIAAAARAPRSAPAPSFGKLARRADPMLNLPTRGRLGPAKQVLRGATPVVVRTASLTRPFALVSGVRPGHAPMGATNLEEGSHSGDGSGLGTRQPRLSGRGAALVASRAQIAGMKPAAYAPPVAINPIQATSKVMVGLSTAPLRTQTGKVQTYPAPPPPPRIGYGIGQAPGVVLPAPPSVYGAGIQPTTESVGSGTAIAPVLDQEPSDGMMIDPIRATAAGAGGTSSRGPLLLLGGGLLALYLLTRKRRSS